MKSISKELLAIAESRYGRADLAWTRSMPLTDDDDFPVLQLPADHLRYSTARGYPVTFAAREHAGGALLAVQIESFATADHDAASWATPTAYLAKGDDQRISQALGFDEGWDDATFECAFLCDASFAVFWRAAVLRKRFGLTCPEIMSLYPVALGDRELAPIEAALAAWKRLPS